LPEVCPPGHKKTGELYRSAPFSALHTRRRTASGMRVRAAQRADAARLVKRKKILYAALQ
jgi:hypothetical protein